MTDDELDAIRERLAAATPGPWTADTYAEAIYALDGAAVVSGSRWGGEASVFDHAPDADFIAHAPTDIAALLAEVERLCAERAQMTEVQEWVGTPDAQEPWRMAYRLHRRLVGPWLPVEDGDQPQHEPSTWRRCDD